MNAQLSAVGGPAQRQRSRNVWKDLNLNDWVLRPLFGVLLAVLALAALAAGGVWFAGFIALITLAGAREWHRLASCNDYSLFLLPTGTAIVGSLAIAGLRPAFVGPPYVAASAVIFAAAAINAALAAGRREEVVWQAAGPLYLALPGLALYALRSNPEHGIWLVLMLFASVWGCDTGALMTGKLIGGPKFLPQLSPNKTWAGYAGGLVTGAAAAAAVAFGLGSDVWRAVLFGLGIALIGHAGDLFESWVKRRFGRKDSGRLIPGHGGMLDRIDSILFAAPACAALVYFIGTRGIFGGLN